MSPEQLQQYFQTVKDKAKPTSDSVVLIVTLSIIAAFVFILATITTPFVLLIVALLIVWALVLVRTSQAGLLGNTYSVRSGKYSYLNELLDEIEKNLGAPNIDVFVQKDIEPKSMVIGHFKKYSIVIDSEALEVLSKEEVRALLAHEAAHVIYRSAGLTSYLRPLSEKIHLFGLGSVIEWIFGFWTRRAELSADRLAVGYTRDPHSMVMALIKMKVGGDFAEFVSEENLLDQHRRENPIIKALAESGMEEPFTITRVVAMLQFCREVQVPIPEQLQNYVDAVSGGKH